MSNESIAKEVGNRIKRIRQAKNISQQALADLMFTTPQNISKYEKEGLSNIDIIRKLSDVLGQDLLKEEVDEEGKVGEIGKEILIQLIENEGFLKIEFIACSLFGMNESRINEEIFKLERIGMCVREQFTNFCGSYEDIVFISAKGIITIKNMNISEDISQMIAEKQDRIITYELLTHGFSCYQEYIDNNEVEKLIRNLPNAGGYRTGYIKYLQSRYDLRVGGCKGTQNNENLIPGKNAFYDIIVQMMLGIDEERLNTFIGDINEEEKSVPLTQDRWSVTKAAEFQFDRDFGCFQSVRDEEIIESLKEMNPLAYIDDDFEMEKEELSGTGYPMDWYSVEEIGAFIEKNVHSARDIQEEKIDDLIKKINNLEPKTLNYYLFPENWEIEGLADKIRSLYDVPKIEPAKIPARVGLGYIEGRIDYFGEIMFDSFDELNLYIKENEHNSLWKNRDIIVNTADSNDVGEVFKHLKSFRPLNQSEINSLINDTAEGFSTFKADWKINEG